uniref:Uncharacterized protein n=1 Tax=Chrysotila carterae TaxID=13221 RepID=A0A7S4B3N6_CHRCT
MLSEKVDLRKPAGPQNFEVEKKPSPAVAQMPWSSSMAALALASDVRATRARSVCWARVPSEVRSLQLSRSEAAAAAAAHSGVSDGERTPCLSTRHGGTASVST